MSEYSLQLEYVIDNNLSEEEKKQERLKGVMDLQDILNEQQILTQKKETVEEKDSRDFAMKQDLLKTQINFVLTKINDILDQYGQELNAETKAKIRYYVDKIMRIKTSTNLDYIRKTAEDLLTFLQEEELFLNKQAHIKDRTKLLVEAKSMTMQLKRKKAKKGFNLATRMRQWRQENIFDNDSPTPTDRFLNQLVGIVIGPIRESDEIIELRHQIDIVNDQLWQYFRLYTQAKTIEFKAETKDGLKRLWSERKKFKEKLKELKREFYKKQRLEGKETSMQKLARETYSFSGWLLAFYLVYYFISIYISSKNFGITEVPNYFFIYRSSFLKYFLSIIFLLHGSLGIKIIFLKKSDVAAYIISPIFAFASILILLNF
jgi:hypothetical protein